MQNTALVVVDMQYDFIDGSLACQNADNAISQTLKFIDKHTKGQGGEEHEILELMDTTDVYVCGIATEYCVRNTCEDLLKAGFNVHLLKDCIAYVDHAGHVKALEEMAQEGISIE